MYSATIRPVLNTGQSVVIDRFIIRTNFTGTVQETHEFANANIDNPAVLQLLRALFTDPDFLKPQRTTDEVTEKLATALHKKGLRRADPAFEKHGIFSEVTRPRCEARLDIAAMHYQK